MALSSFHSEMSTEDGIAAKRLRTDASGMEGKRRGNVLISVESQPGSDDIDPREERGTLTLKARFNMYPYSSSNSLELKCYFFVSTTKDAPLARRRAYTLPSLSSKHDCATVR